MYRRRYGYGRNEDRFDNYCEIDARYASTGTCGHEIAKGDRIGWHPGLKKTQCTDCWARWSSENAEAAMLAMLEQVVKSLVGLRGRPEAGELAHRPAPLAIHLRMGAAGIRKFARFAQVAARVEVRQIRVAIDRLDRTSGDGSGPGL